METNLAQKQEIVNETDEFAENNRTQSSHNANRQGEKGEIDEADAMGLLNRREAWRPRSPAQEGLQVRDHGLVFSVHVIQVFAAARSPRLNSLTSQGKNGLNMVTAARSHA